MKMILKGIRLEVYYQVEGEKEKQIARIPDVSFLSDEACDEGWFTGLMCGICCQDLTGAGKYADFDWFKTAEGESAVEVKSKQ